MEEKTDNKLNQDMINELFDMLRRSKSWDQSDSVFRLFHQHIPYYGKDKTHDEFWNERKRIFSLIVEHYPQLLSSEKWFTRYWALMILRKYDVNESATHEFDLIDRYIGKIREMAENTQEKYRIRRKCLDIIESSCGRDNKYIERNIKNIDSICKCTTDENPLIRHKAISKLHSLVRYYDPKEKQDEYHKHYTLKPCWMEYIGEQTPTILNTLLDDGPYVQRGGFMIIADLAEKGPNSFYLQFSKNKDTFKKGVEKAVKTDDVRVMRLMSRLLSDSRNNDIFADIIGILEQNKDNMKLKLKFATQEILDSWRERKEQKDGTIERELKDETMSYYITRGLNLSDYTEWHSRRLKSFKLDLTDENIEKILVAVKEIETLKDAPMSFNFLGNLKFIEIVEGTDNDLKNQMKHEIQKTISIYPEYFLLSISTKINQLKLEQQMYYPNEKKHYVLINFLTNVIKEEIKANGNIIDDYIKNVKDEVVSYNSIENWFVEFLKIYLSCYPERIDKELKLIFRGKDKNFLKSKNVRNLRGWLKNKYNIDVFNKEWLNTI